KPQATTDSTETPNVRQGESRTARANTNTASKKDLVAADAATSTAPNTTAQANAAVATATEGTLALAPEVELALSDVPAAQQDNPAAPAVDASKTTNIGAPSRVPDALTAAQRLGGATQNAARQVNGNEGGNTVPVDRVRFVQRVSKAFQQLWPDGGVVRLRLSPPDLGSMRIEVAVRSGVMTARVEAETAAAQHALIDQLPVLRERLAEQQIRIERFDVDVRTNSHDGSPRQPFDQDRTPRQARVRSNASAAAPAGDVETPAPARALGSNGRLNVII
ncbi:MAG: flagellar hook-length control protein FliK, partial [Pirellulales bacterium]|nr:flagellar hook-length control protein FliK [Pirellulales bacterium]